MKLIILMNIYNQNEIRKGNKKYNRHCEAKMST